MLLFYFILYLYDLYMFHNLYEIYSVVLIAVNIYLDIYIILLKNYIILVIILINYE